MNAHLNSKNGSNLSRCISPRVSFTLPLVHEVRNRLTIVNLAIDMLTPTLLNADQKIYVDLIKGASLRINSLITELLNSGEPGEMCSDN
jgi:hypothetical protein